MPDIFNFFVMVKDFYVGIFAALDIAVLNVSGIQVTYGSILFVVLVVGMVISVFWRGAKT